MMSIKFRRTVRVAVVLGSLILSACQNNDDGATDHGATVAIASAPIDVAQDGSAPGPAPGPINAAINVPNAFIPPQCYTRTQDVDDEAGTGRVHNPCYVCHANGRPPNQLDDSSVQTEYSLPGPALQNPWTNLFEDRSARIAEIDNEAILRYVRDDNYRDPDGQLSLARRLRTLPAAWDLEGDGQWNGYIPDAYFNFDDAGYDHAPDGGLTGWRAFGYYPFPGTFWPTNGSTDDVLIRLDEAFRQGEDGAYDPDVYRANFAIVESLVKRADVAIDPIDERRLNVDLDKDGKIGTADHVAYDWAPRDGRQMSYVGRARQRQAEGEVHLAAGLFPEGTEFLHSVRYINVDDSGDISLAPRMKELRYARKTGWYNYSELKQIADRENKERALDANVLHQVPGDMERGLFNQGWRYQGFIEDHDGALRPQSKEETLFCMGCHGGVSATADTIFSFPRKVDAAGADHRGWYHWTQHGLRGLPEPRRFDGRYEYTLYLEENGAGDELRANTEVLQRFFDADGTLKPQAVAELHEDIGSLLLPSPARALALNKAYRTIVEDQDFTQGRDGLPQPARNVWETVEQGQRTGITRLVVQSYP